MGGLKNDFIKVAGSNFLLLFASTLNNFVLPIILSISDYANYKTYILYASFCGFFHLGYVDGINIKYGGKSLQDVDSHTFWSEHHFFVLTQFVLTIVLLICAYASRSLVMMLFALTVTPINMQSFFLFFTQAVGQFTVYAKCMIVVPFLMSFSTCLIFVTHISCNYIFFCLINFFCYIVSWCLLSYQTRRVIPWSWNLDLNHQLENHKSIYKSGFFIMMGTIVFSLFSSIGRWLIKWNMDDESFAVYSMAASLLGFVLILVNAVNKVFYPYLCKNDQDKKKNTQLVDVLLFLATMSLPFFYLLKIIIELILPKYCASISIVRILLMTLPAVIIIQSYYINLYKARKLERLYLRDCIVYTIIAAIINSLAMLFFRDLNAMAVASVLCSYLWLFMPNKVIYQPSNKGAKLVYFFLVFAFYIFSGLLFHNPLLSFFLSLVSIFGVNLFFLKESIIPLIYKR